MLDWPKLEMTLPASKVRPRGVNCCSDIAGLLNGPLRQLRCPQLQAQARISVTIGAFALMARCVRDFAGIDFSGYTALASPES
jgi:hypothetical protein